MEKSIRITNQNNEDLVAFLNLLLADEYILYTKTRIAHWNIVGPEYFELNVFLENNYYALEVMIAEITEQISSLGHFALVSLKDFISITKIRDYNNDFTNSAQIFESLIKKNESLIHIIQQEISPISNKFNDIDLADFLKRLMTQHEHMVMMLRTFLLRNNYYASAYDFDRANQLIDWKD